MIGAPNRCSSKFVTVVFSTRVPSIARSASTNVGGAFSEGRECSTSRNSGSNARPGKVRQVLGNRQTSFGIDTERLTIRTVTDTSRYYQPDTHHTAQPARQTAVVDEKRRYRRNRFLRTGGRQLCEINTLQGNSRFSIFASADYTIRNVKMAASLSDWGSVASWRQVARL